MPRNVEPIRIVASSQSDSSELVAPLDGRQGQHHRHRRADQDEGVDRRQVDAQRVDQPRGRAPARRYVSSPSMLGRARRPASSSSEPAPRRRPARRRESTRTTVGSWSRRWCSSSSTGSPLASWISSTTTSSVVAGVLDDDAAGVLAGGQVGAGGEQVAVGAGRAAGSEDDVRADQAGEEHDLGGEEQPHRHLARRGRRRGAVAGPGSGGWACSWGSPVGSSPKGGVSAISGSLDRSTDATTRLDATAARRRGRRQAGSGLSSNSSRTAGR